MSGRWTRAVDWLGRYRWPAGIVAIIAVFFVADGLLIATAFSARNVGPEEQYYERALQHDDVRAAVQRADGRALPPPAGGRVSGRQVGRRDGGAFVRSE